MNEKALTDTIPLHKVASAPVQGMDNDGDGWHQQPSNEPSRRASSTVSSSSKWSETIRKVLRGNDDQWKDENDSEPDLVGEEIARLINASPAFKRPQHQEIRRDNEDDIRFEPLLTSRNVQRLFRWIVHVRPQHVLGCFRFVQDKYNAGWSYVFRERQSIRRSAKVLGLLLIGSLIVLVTVSYMTIMWLLRALVLYGRMTLSLLFDLEEIKSSCPTFLKISWNILVKLVGWFDDNVFFRKKYAGREWNETEFVWRGNAKSQEETLWQCPPPCAGAGLLQSTHMQKHEWSLDSVNHILAVEFCHGMLLKEHLRKQASNRRKTLKRAASGPVGDFAWTDKRAEFANYNKARSDHSVPFSKPGSSTLSPIEQGPGDHDFWSDDEPNRSSTISPSRTDVGEGLNLQSDSQLSPNASSFRRRSYSESDVGSSSCRDTDCDIEDESSLDSAELRFTKTRQVDISNGSEAGPDMNWLDLGASIGFRLLNSEHVQKAIASQDTAERIMDISGKMEGEGNLLGNESILDFNVENLAAIGGAPAERNTTTSPDAKLLITPQRPVHSMWTSPAAVASNTGVSVSSMSDMEDSSLASDIPSPPRRHHKRIVNDNNIQFPPRSPKKGTPENKRIKKGKNLHDSRSERELHLTMPTERRDETEIYFDAKLSSKLDSPRISEAFETSLPSNRSEVVPLPSLASSSKPSIIRRPALSPGIKVVVPMFPLQPTSTSAVRPIASKRARRQESQFQMATVISSKRIYVHDPRHPRKFGDHRRYSNCLSVTVTLDKSFLRSGEFAKMTFRVMDKWSSRFMPKHSKFPIGACVATSFGVGVLVSWRVEDDCHVVRSLWQHKEAGRAHAYLNRDAIHGVVEAGVGFDVETKLGRGTVLAYVNGGRTFRSGRYFVHLKDEGRHKGTVLEFNRADIISCQGAQFIPIIEYIREAAQYQIQVDNYEAALRKQNLELSDKPSKEEKLFRSWSKGFEMLWSSFLKAIEEDNEFDVGMSEFVSSIITFLEHLDNQDTQSDPGKSSAGDKIELVNRSATGDDVSFGPPDSSTTLALPDEGKNNVFWILDGMFGGVFQLPGKKKESEESSGVEIVSLDTLETERTLNFRSRFSLGSAGSDMSANESYRRAFAILRVMMRTVAIAHAACADKPNFKLALSIVYEFLLFVRTVVKVQQKNVSPESIAAWKRTIAEFAAIFGPLKERLEKIGRGIAERVEKQGKRAKVSILRFVDIVLVDELLLSALEEGQWDQCLIRVERALVKARVIEPESREHYRKCLMFIYDHMVPASSSDGAAARNGEKLAQLAKALKWLASPRRSLLSLLKRDDVLEIVERIFVRVFRKDKVASRMLSIHASNFHSFRHLRMLKDFTISGKLWMPLLDAADEEFAWAGSRMPETTKEFVSPLSKLFSLGVTQFQRKNAGDLTVDWLDFLIEDDAVQLIHEMDMKLILGLESFCKDVKEVMVVLPYYPSIDDDILNLMDEVDFDEFLKDASEALNDPEGLAAFLKEKATIAIERFLGYLPKMSIPVERREIGDDWVITCRGENGGDLKLSDVNIKRENMVCQIIGSDNVFFPMFGDDSMEISEVSSEGSSAFEATAPKPLVATGKEESSVLDNIRDLLINAQSHGCWKTGVGGVGRPPSDRYVRSVLQGLPVSNVLNSGIELWRNLEIDDDELLEIAIRDVSYQIQLQKKRDLGLDALALPDRTTPSFDLLANSSESNALEFPFGRFNPRRDPTVLYLEMNKLTLNLDNFMFRIEKAERKTILDPVFDGCGSLSVRNVSIKLRVECRKERIVKLGSNVTVPVLFLSELDVRLAQVLFKVKDTGADWILNKVVDGFSDNISRVVEANLKEQVSEQLNTALQNLNSYFEVNSELFLNLLGISMDDLEENVVWV